MSRDFRRLLAPSRIAVIGGGAWAEAILGAAARIGFAGTVVPVHPSRAEMAGVPAVRSVADLDGVVDAAFVCVNRRAAVDVVGQLTAAGCGGAVCFASGFSEAGAEDCGGVDLQAHLVAAAGEMPLLGPNCYGFVNALDRAAIWPDQHGMTPVDRGVAILTQSSNVAINMTMQRRGLPIAMMITCGNMAQTTQAELAAHLLDDPRITGIGLHIEGFGDLRAWEALARKAFERRVPLVALKVGRSEAARAATQSHTASLAGSDAGAEALLARLGIARARAVADFLETLKIFHMAGPLRSSDIASISCSGGEASLVADLGEAEGLRFPEVEAAQKQALRQVLGPMVTIANPLDYHTYIWRDRAAMGKAWASMAAGPVSMTLSVVDYPHTDASDWDCATGAAMDARATSGKPFAVVSSLPELMPPDTAAHLAENGVIPLFGLSDALAAVRAAADTAAPEPEALCLPGGERVAVLLSEPEAKRELTGFGIAVPPQPPHSDGPFAVKAVGLAHKSDQGAVVLNVPLSGLEAAREKVGTGEVLVEEMVTDGVAEMLIGVVRDPAHGFVLTLGAGGVLTEIMEDSVSLLVPARRYSVARALDRLRCARLLDGYRGRLVADKNALLDTIMALQSYVVAHADTLEEVEINPLIVTPDRAVAADALIRKAPG